MVTFLDREQSDPLPIEARDDSFPRSLPALNVGCIRRDVEYKNGRLRHRYPLSLPGCQGRQVVDNDGALGSKVFQ